MKKILAFLFDLVVLFVMSVGFALCLMGLGIVLVLDNVKQRD